LNGYTAVIQDQRGSQKSTGQFDLWTMEGEDSTDVADWISKQIWSNGEVYYTGASADGMPGNMAVTDDPSRMKGEWQIWTAENGHNFAYPQGAYRQDLMEGYLNMMSGSTHGTSAQVTLPKIESKEAYDDWWAQITLERSETDSTQQPFLYGKVNWPIVDNVGWWDLFQHTHLTHWKHIRAYSDESVRDQHVLVVGPLGHCIAQPGDHVRLVVAEADGLVVGAEAASELFKGKFDGKTLSKIGRVNLFVMGSFHQPLGGSAPGNYWTSLDDFPSPEPTKFFLGAKGSLESAAPTESAMLNYVYDPSTDAGKTPMLGGNNLPGMGTVPGCGTYDQMPKANRSDILIFDSEPLSDDTGIAGDLSARLFVGSSAKDTDFFVTVEDLAPDGKKSFLVRYGMARMRWLCGDETPCPALEAGEVYPVDIDLWASAYIFPKGHSIRVSVSSAAYPYYNFNPNTGDALYTDQTGVAATNEIHISPDYPSSVSLPVVALSDIPQNKNWGPVIPDVIV